MSEPIVTELEYYAVGQFRSNGTLWIDDSQFYGRHHGTLEAAKRVADIWNKDRTEGNPYDVYRVKTSKIIEKVV